MAKAEDEALPISSGLMSLFVPGDFFSRNSAWVRPGEHSYNTELAPEQEKAFLKWVQENKVPFDPAQKTSDYDMRGFWKALQEKDPRAVSGINPNDQRLHYPDFWKTPYHETFSAESQWADPEKAPRWNEKDQLVLPSGKVLFDERKKKD